MTLIKPRQPKGMRDFLPDDLLKRQYVFDTVIDIFETFGFEPLQTPALELRQTLHGNLGEEAEKQIFYAQHPLGKEELALRYDLTVPLARVVAQYEGQITMPFKRYHIAPVWRSERPQRGRYREFYQCDADIVGVASMAADAEIISLVNMGHLREELAGVAIAEEGIRELEAMARHLAAFDVPEDKYTFDFTMVRGLGYYTGPVFETIITEPNLGSVTGGGRYDNLIGMFRKHSLPTTGTSLGIERIIDLMDELDLYPPALNRTVVQVLVTVFGEDTRAASERFASHLRQAGIRTEVMLENRKIGKQTAYANRKGIPVVAYLGTDEIAAGTVTLKRLRDGETRVVPQTEAAEAVRVLLA